MRLTSQKSALFIIAVLIASLIQLPQFAFAVGSSGFENASYSARSLGQGNAVVARPQDPDTVAFNPAGIPDLKGVQVGTNLEGITSHTWFKSSVTHDTEKSASQLILVPTGYMTANLGEKFDNRVGVGLGFNFPFGLSNRYESQSRMGRYAGYKNQIKLAALTYALGVKLHEKINVGGSIVNYQLYQYDQTFNYPNPASLQGFGFQTPDGIARTNMQGSAWGWTLSTLIKPIEKHQFGINYRSRADVRAKGKVVIDGLVAGQLQGFTTTPYFETGAKTDVPLPSQLTLGYAYVPSKKWSAEVDVAWTGWSVFADQDFEFNDDNAVLQSLGKVPRNFHNTLSLNVGGHYKPGKKIDWIGGMWFYTKAAPDETFDAVIPDSNRFAVSFGFTYPVTNRLDFSTIYFANLFERRSIENQSASSKTGFSIDGEYISFIHAFMTGFTYKFGKLDEEPNANIQNAPATASPIIKTFPANKA